MCTTRAHINPVLQTHMCAYMQLCTVLKPRPGFGSLRSLLHTARRRPMQVEANPAAQTRGALAIPPNTRDLRGSKNGKSTRRERKTADTRRLIQEILDMGYKVPLSACRAVRQPTMHNTHTCLKAARMQCGYSHGHRRTGALVHPQGRQGQKHATCIDTRGLRHAATRHLLHQPVRTQ